MKKNILGLDLGTNSIGWAVIEQDFNNKQGKIVGIGSRIIPMSQEILGKFESGQSVSQTAERTDFRSKRRLYQRKNLRRERLHRVLNILDFLPEHYKDKIDFTNKKGQFNQEVKIDYKKNKSGKYEFIFKDSFLEMVEDFKKDGKTEILPYDWTIYYLRQKALKQPISKEELAWILLNFNQKRGYYQLRGEEEEEKEGKEKTFEVLQVAEVKETDEKSKDGKTLYEIYFSNGWKYDKLTTKPEDWIGKTKEFIVTHTQKKNGSIKLSFKQVDSEQDWIAIKKKTENDIENSGKHVSEYIYDHLLKDPKQKIRGKLIKTIERKFYKKELASILEKQKEFHPELTNQNLLEKSLLELYPHNEGHRNQLKNKDFKHLFLEDIIFYQRPLKSQKSLISECPFEKIEFYKREKDSETGEIKMVPTSKGIKVISKSHPLFQEFRLWQFLHNLKIHQRELKEMDRVRIDVDVTEKLLAKEEDWEKLYNYLKDRKEVSQKNIVDFLIKERKIDKMEKSNYRWNYPEDKKYPAMPTRAGFLSRLKKVKDVNPASFLTPEREEELWHLVYSIQDKIEFKKALKKFAKKNSIDIESFVTAFEKHPPYDSQYGAFSKKAIKKLLPLMRVGSYWHEEDITPEAKERIESIKERLEAINFDPERLEEISDDEIPKAVAKSFLKMKNKNMLKGLQTHQATYATYGRHSELGDIQHWKSPADIENYIQNFKQHSLRNPIVEQTVIEALKTVKDIWQHYGDGQADFFDEIHVELARELKNPADVRKKISQKNAENERTNKRIKALLKELIQEGAQPQSPNHLEILKIYEEDVINSEKDRLPKEIEEIRKNNSPTQSQIEKYKLWLEQKYISPYTGKPIPLSKLFSTEYQIEHIIPQSRYFDNSMNNKVICESAVNLDKSNKTAYEYIKEKGGSIVDGHKLLDLKAYESHCQKYFKNNKRKLKNLLSEDIPESFIERQLNDTRYISKIIKGLLSNIVREEGENAETAKKLIPVTGSITSKLKHDWGLNDKWNEIILPRFKRLNELTNTHDFTYLNQNGIEVPKIPDYISGKINKKRIDHRHHALDALVVAATTRNHINYLNALNNDKIKHELQPQLLIKNEQGHYTKTFQMPWKNFPTEASSALKNTVASFKQNLRVINKATNKYWKWVEQEDGSYKKQQVPQTKGEHWAIRKPLHKETVYGKLDNIKTPKNKIATAVKTDLSAISNQKHVAKIVDKQIREVIIPNHLKNYTDENGKIDFATAFSPEGIEQLNKNLTQLNNGKPHQPIYKVKMYEIGQRFPLSDNPESPKHKKYVEAAQGTNLFFNVYWNEKKQKRNYETVPLKEVIEHQKQVAHLPKEERTPAPVNPELGDWLFSLSPNDLVYVPNEDENINNIDFNNLTAEQKKRIYKMVSSTGNRCFFIPVNIAQAIYNKHEFSVLNKIELTDDKISIKEKAIKLKTDRLGNIKRY